MYVSVPLRPGKDNSHLHDQQQQSHGRPGAKEKMLAGIAGSSLIQSVMTSAQIHLHIERQVVVRSEDKQQKTAPINTWPNGM